MTEWSGLDRFLQTDPRDVGCEQAMAILHVYVELVAGRLGRRAALFRRGRAACGVRSVW
jgi:hypothetical protein